MNERLVKYNLRERNFMVLLRNFKDEDAMEYLQKQNRDMSLEEAKSLIAK